MGREQDWLYPAIVIAAATTAWAAAFKLVTGFPSPPSGVGSLSAALTIVVMIAVARFLFYFLGLWREREEDPIARMCADLRPAATNLTLIAVGVTTLGIFLKSVSYLKSMIPAVVPFWADAAFAATDRAFFIDQQAFALALAPALPALGLFYALWHAAHLGGIMWVLHWQEGQKARHILSFMLTWTIGMALAYAFSSAGPIFTGLYDPAIAPESVRRAASFLWMNYQSEGALLGGGISAFPSMHVAVATWLAIVLRDRGLFWLGAPYLIGVLVCSIILGWHYAIDGVAGIGVAVLADRLAQGWLRQRRASSSIIAQPAAVLN